LSDDVIKIHHKNHPCPSGGGEFLPHTVETRRAPSLQNVASPQHIPVREYRSVETQCPYRYMASRRGCILNRMQKPVVIAFSTDCRDGARPVSTECAASFSIQNYENRPVIRNWKFVIETLRALSLQNVASPQHIPVREYRSVETQYPYRHTASRWGCILICCYWLHS
jgi:hypothetical protein